MKHCKYPAMELLILSIAALPFAVSAHLSKKKLWGKMDRGSKIRLKFKKK